MLYSSYLITGCAIIFSKLRFDDDLRIEIIRYDKIRRLVEPITR